MEQFNAFGAFMNVRTALIVGGYGFIFIIISLL